MDIAAYSVASSMQSLQAAVSVSVLDKAMNVESQAAQYLVADFAAANPPAQILAPKAGSMNIRV